MKRKPGVTAGRASVLSPSWGHTDWGSQAECHTISKSLTVHPADSRTGDVPQSVCCCHNRILRLSDKQKSICLTELEARRPRWRGCIYSLILTKVFWATQRLQGVYMCVPAQELCGHVQASSQTWHVLTLATLVEVLLTERATLLNQYVLSIPKIFFKDCIFFFNCKSINTYHKYPGFADTLNYNWRPSWDRPYCFSHWISANSSPGSPFHRGFFSFFFFAPLNYFYLDP